MIAPSTAQQAPDLMTFLQAVTDGRDGWLELWGGHTRATDPGKIDLDTNYAKRHRWHWYEPARLHEIIAECERLTRSHKNVYLSLTLYDRPARPCNGGVPLPSRVIFADDAPTAPPLPYSMAVQTSRGSGHGYYLLDTAVDAATRRELQARVAAGLGADKSGKDIEQLGRTPGSFNTKHHQRQPVELLYTDGPRYTVEQIRAAFPELPPARTRANLGDLDHEAVTRHLSHLDRLLRRVKPHTVTYQHLHSDGGPDRSARRWGLACELRNRFGFVDDEIAALLIGFTDWGHSTEKGSDWFVTDVQNCIAGARQLHPDAKTSPTRYLLTRPSQPLPEVPRTRKGRRCIITDHEYLDWLHAHADADTVQQTQREIAGELGVSVETVRRLEARLRADGLLQRHTTLDRKRSWLVLTGAVKIAEVGTVKIAADAAVAAAEIPEEVLSQPPRIVDARARGEETHPPGAPAPSPVPLPRAPALVVHEPLTAVDVGPDEWAQSRIGRLPRARPVAERPPEEQKRALEAQLGKVRSKKHRLKRAGRDFEIPGLERAAADLQERIAEMEAISDNQHSHQADESKPLSATPAADQLTLDAAHDAPGLPGAVCSSLGPSDAVQPSPLAFATGAEALQAFYRAWKSGDGATAAAVIDAAERLYPMLDWEPERARLGGGT